MSRKAPFTAFEKEFLKELVAQHVDVLESKKTDADFNHQKAKIWKKITDSFNGSSMCQEATEKQLKKAWQNLKAKARDAKSLQLQRKHTGGGPAIPEMPPEHDYILSLVNNIMPTINVTRDSDGTGETEADDDNEAWLPKAKRQRVSLTPEPLAPAPAPVPAPTPAPVPAPAAVPAQAIKQKKTIEELKLQLIQDDIERRRKRFDIEIEHVTKINDLKYKMTMLEYEHKKNLYKLIEQEQERKLRL